MNRCRDIYQQTYTEPAEFTDDGMYELPGSYERENYYDEYIVDDAALKEQLVEMFYREVE